MLRRSSWFVFLLAAWAPAQKQEYVRVRFTSPEGGVLETPILHCQNEAGVVVDLIGAVHIAERRYYLELNRRFRSYDVVLFEMVKPKGAPATARGWNPLSALQRLIRSALGLTFQLDAVDYTAPNMVHADMDAATFMRHFRKEMPRLLARLREQAGKNGLGGVTELKDWVQALFRPDRPRRLKLLLARELNADKNLTLLTGWLEDSVLVEGRNRIVIRKLREELERGRRRIGIFYGVGHLPDLERKLAALGFHRTGVTWLAAWDFRAPPRRRRL